MVGVLLFAAFAFFAFGQASATRSKAQGAADAAALAAAGDARDHLLPGWHLGTLKRGDWEKLLDGDLFDDSEACAAAEAYAADNGSHVAAGGCGRNDLDFEVTVETDDPVGNTVVPGTADRRATADATARIQPRCHLGEESGPGDDPPPPGGGDDEDPQPVEIQCDDGNVVQFDPLDPKPWKALARILFTVRLVD